MSQVARSLPELIKIYPARRSRPLDPLTLESGVSGNDYQMEEGRGILGNPKIYLAELARYKNVTLNATAKQKRLSSEEIQKIQELKEEGKTQREIAEQVGVHEATISRNLQNDKCQNASSDSPPSYLEPDDPTEALPILGNPKTRNF